MLHDMLTDAAKLDEFAREGEVDFSYSIEGLARFRVNAFRQRGLDLAGLPRDPVHDQHDRASSTCPT